MRGFAIACSLLCVAFAHAAEDSSSSTGPVLLIVEGSTGRQLAAALRQRPGAPEPVSPSLLPEPASESVLSAVRPQYAAMAFDRAVRMLQDAERTLIEGRVPSPGVVKALAEVELWMGACLLLQGHSRAAEERFAMASRLEPSARPDPIFPPEVERAFASARSASPVRLRVRLAPTGARLWIDGRPAPARPSAAPGLHYVAVERADLEPKAKIVRVIRAAPQIAASLDRPASATAALRFAAARIHTAELAPIEGAGVARALGRSLWVVSAQGGRMRALRYQPEDGGTGPTRVAAPENDPAELVLAICELEPSCATPIVEAASAPEPVAAAPSRSAAPAAPAAPAAAVAVHQPPPPPPRRPTWKRAWFWATLGAAAVVLGGAAAGLALGLTSERDYVATVR